MSTLVRVSVASSTRRVDLVLPGSVPVAELVPELARSVGLLGSGTVPSGYRVVTSSGRRLLGDSSLTAQGVEDGVLLMVAEGANDPPPRRYDDLVEAVADIVERGADPLTPTAGAVVALGAASALLGVGAAALVLQRSGLAAAGACVTAGLLVLTSIGVSRIDRSRPMGVCMAWQGIGYAALAGFMLAGDGQPVATRVAAAGVGATVAGVLTTAGLARSRLLVAPAVGSGAVLAAAGTLIGWAGLPADVGFPTLMVLVVVAGSMCPWVALGVVGAGPALDDCETVDVRTLECDVRIGHEILLAVSLAVGATVIVLVPFAVASGLPGACLAASACLVLVLRTRHHRHGSEVLVGLASGVLGLVGAAATVLWLHPAWKPGVAVVMVIGGFALLATSPGARPSLRGDRLANLAEFTALASLVPLLVLAGLPEIVPG